MHKCAKADKVNLTNQYSWVLPNNPCSDHNALFFEIKIIPKSANVIVLFITNILINSNIIHT